MSLEIILIIGGIIASILIFIFVVYMANKAIKNSDKNDQTQKEKFVVPPQILKSDIIVAKQESPSVIAAPGSLGKRLRVNGWYLYINPSCPWCKKQMEELGDDVKELTIIDCSKYACPSADKGVPMWENKELLIRQTGFKSRDELWKLA